MRALSVAAVVALFGCPPNGGIDNPVGLEGACVEFGDRPLERVDAEEAQEAIAKNRGCLGPWARANPDKLHALLNRVIGGGGASVGGGNPPDIAPPKATDPSPPTWKGWTAALQLLDVLDASERPRASTILIIARAAEGSPPSDKVLRRLDELVDAWASSAEAAEQADVEVARAIYFLKTRRGEEATRLLTEAVLAGKTGVATTLEVLDVIKKEGDDKLRGFCDQLDKAGQTGARIECVRHLQSPTEPEVMAILALSPGLTWEKLESDTFVPAALRSRLSDAKQGCPISAHWVARGSQRAAGLEAIFGRLADSAMGAESGAPAALCYASVAAAGCMTAMQNAKGCEDASAIARYVRILPPSEFTTFLSAFIEGKTGIYRGPEARTEKGKRALILMHLALASILEDHPMPGHGEVYDPKYHRRQAKLLTDEVFAGNKDLKVLFE